MNNKRRKEIELLANDIRSLSKVSTYGIEDIFNLCADRKYYIVRYPLGENAVLGAAIKRNGDYIIVSNSSSVLSREIFTVAHEIGHIVLNHLENQSSSMIADYTKTDGSKPAIETEADYFAACLLMPKEKVEDYCYKYFEITGTWSILEIVQLQDVFNVSFDTVINRLQSLNAIDEDLRAEIELQKTHTTINKVLKAIGGSSELCFPANVKKIPIDFLKWVKANYQNKLISKEILLKALGYVDLQPGDIGISEENDCDDEDDFDIDSFMEDID